MPVFLFILTFLWAPPPAIAQNKPLPVIDMHLHALTADSQGPPPAIIGAPDNYCPSAIPGVPDRNTTRRFLPRDRIPNGRSVRR